MNSDHSIETVLSALKSTQPPAGLEARILANLYRDQPLHVRAPRRSWFAVTPFAFAAAALMLAASAALLLTRSQANTKIPASLTQAQRPKPQPATDPVQHPLGLVASTTSRRPLHADPRPLSMDELALEEMRAPSQPAPPLPLTEEERLLLQAIRNGETQELAELNSDVLHALEARDKADFYRFFPASAAAAPQASAPGTDEPAAEAQPTRLPSTIGPSPAQSTDLANAQDHATTQDEPTTSTPDGERP